MDAQFSFRESSILVGSLLAMIFVSMVGLGIGPHMVLLLANILVCLFAVCVKKWAWDSLENFMVQGVASCLKAIFILGFIGILISVWMLSGTVPTIFYYGLETLSPDWFLFSSLIICIVVSCFTGSSLTTAGTVGVALMGIAHSFNIEPGPAAGAIICGACFGDKVSPLSDTTNFAPGVVGVELFAHIKHLLWTTVPALACSMVFFILYPAPSGDELSFLAVDATKAALTSSFEISFLTLFSPFVVFFMAAKRFPTLPVLCVGLFSGLLTAGLVQNNWDISQWFEILQNGYHLESSNAVLNSIVNRGGLMSMMFSISLVLIALSLGGLLQGLGVISSLMNHTLTRLKSSGSIVASTCLASIGINFLTGEQYLSILLPGQAFEPLYGKNGLSKATLSRALEDGGTLVNPLVPWGVCGAFFANALGVSVGEYAIYSLFLYLSPVFSITLAYLGIGLSDPKTA